MCDAELVIAASFFFGIHDSVYAELMALHHGLELCLEHNFHGVQVETDSMLIVQWLRYNYPLRIMKSTS